MRALCGVDILEEREKRWGCFSVNTGIFVLFCFFLTAEERRINTDEPYLCVCLCVCKRRLDLELYTNYCDDWGFYTKSWIVVSQFSSINMRLKRRKALFMLLLWAGVAQLTPIRGCNVECNSATCSVMPLSLSPSSICLWHTEPTDFVSAVIHGAVGLHWCWF